VLPQLCGEQDSSSNSSSSSSSKEKYIRNGFEGLKSHHRNVFSGMAIEA
jgi:hypothetical protein